MYFLMCFLALLAGVNDVPVNASQVEFSAEVMVEKWKYDFEKDKWEKKWLPAEVDEKGVRLKRNQRFAIRVESNHAYFSNAKIALDGKDRGTWKLKPWYTGFLKKCIKGNNFVFREQDVDLHVSFTSHQNKETKTIKLKLVKVD